MKVPPRLVDALNVTWQQCGACWGQRIVLVPVHGAGFTGRSCHHCLGVGERMSVHADGAIGGL